MNNRDTDSTAQIPLLLEIEQLEALQTNPNVILVDVGSEERFLSAHISGAKLITPAMTQAGPPFPGLLPQADQLQRIVDQLDITADSHLIIYDDEGGGWAGRFIWLLDSIGFQNYSYLNGGLIAWHEAGLPLVNGPEAFTPKTADAQTIKICINTEVSVTWEQLVEALDTPDIAIWDARNPLEYSGQKVLAAKAGHIPGARNYEWTEAMDRSNGLRLKPQETLLEELAQSGLTTDKQIITHCQTHHRSGLTYLVAKILGFTSVRAYPGSWSEWGNLADTPVEI